jgi:hypothetical protein
MVLGKKHSGHVSSFHLAPFNRHCGDKDMIEQLEYLEVGEVVDLDFFSVYDLLDPGASAFVCLRVQHCDYFPRKYQ